MIAEFEGEHILLQLKDMESRLINKIDDSEIKLAAKIKDLEVANGMLFRSDKEQELRFHELERRVSDHAALRAARSGREAGGKWGALGAAIVSVILAVAAEWLKNF